MLYMLCHTLFSFYCGQCSKVDGGYLCLYWTLNQEEQKVIEAKIRMRQQEMEEEEERQHKKEETSSSERDPRTENIDCSTSGGVECEETAPSQDSNGTQMLRQPHTRHGRCVTNCHLILAYL